MAHRPTTTRSVRQHLADAPGQDSFLDVVANLVGILIILVMVVGARAKDAWVHSVRIQPPAEVTKLKERLDQSRRSTAALERDLNELGEKLKLQQAAISARRAERDQLQLLITAAQRQLDEQRSQLSAGDRSMLDLRRQLAEARATLDQLQQQRISVEQAAKQTMVIKHIPTPMAKTVFGKEVHFRLLHDRIVYVPLEALIEKMKSEIRFKAEKLKHASQTVETVGPIGGFHLRYVLRLAERIEQTRYGTVRGKVPQFVGFYLIPTDQTLGQPLDEALQPGSLFNRHLAGLDPNTTTITVWVYPDSFDAFLRLKQYLYQRGFLTAGWPLPEGQPIAGGPHGRRSAAQ